MLIRGFAHLLKQKSQTIFPPKLRGYTISALTSGKLRKSEVVPLGFALDLQHSSTSLSSPPCPSPPCEKAEEQGSRCPFVSLHPQLPEDPEGNHLWQYLAINSPFQTALFRSHSTDWVFSDSQVAVSS